MDFLTPGLFPASFLIFDVMFCCGWMLSFLGVTHVDVVNDLITQIGHRNPQASGVA